MLTSSIQQVSGPRLQASSISIAPTGIIREIGGTPLLSLSRITSHLPETVSVLVKAEFLNPGGSVKARPAWRMMSEGLRSGALDRNKILIDATSGNTGIAYAMLGAALGLQVRLVMPANVSEPRIKIVQSFGAELELTDPNELTDGAQRHVMEVVRRDPDTYFYPDQYNNRANWEAHFDTTGQEIWAQTAGGVTHFVSALGTTGTFTGVSRCLKELKPDTLCVAVQPDMPLHGIEGVKHLESAMVPGIFDVRLVDEDIRVSTDEAMAMTRRLALEEGLLVGISSGANVVASLRVAERLEEGMIVSILCDSGTHYQIESKSD